MAYQRVWVPELNQWKIIGEDTGEYAQIYASNPGAFAINIPASTGQIIVSMPSGEPIIAGNIPEIGQLADLSQLGVITPYIPTPTPTPTPIQTTYTPTRNGTIDKGSNVLGVGAVGLLSLLIFALGRKK